MPLLAMEQSRRGKSRATAPNRGNLREKVTPARFPKKKKHLLMKGGKINKERRFKRI